MLPAYLPTCLPSSPRVAITTDWLVTFGGAERVIAEMLKIFPDATVFSTVYREGALSPLHPTVHTSALQKWYKLTGSHRLLLPWMPRAVESWDLSDYDVIVSSSHAVAKGCIPKSPARHICYCHTPMRYAWEMEEEYLDDFKLVGPMRSFVKWQLKKLRHWDRTTAKRVDLFIANSKTTQERIKRYYGRESIVLHPPVDDRFFTFSSNESQACHPACRPKPKRRLERSRRARGSPYFLTVGRLVPYKRFDLLIDVANRENIQLKIAGEGPDEARLKKKAGDTVEFLGHVPEADLPALYANARALLFPTHEDAGIVPLEAQACGTPVIAFGKGGALDTVVARESLRVQDREPTGIFFQEQTVESLMEALQRFETMQFDAKKIREHAKKFSGEKFRERLREIVGGQC